MFMHTVVLRGKRDGIFKDCGTMNEQILFHRVQPVPIEILALIFRVLREIDNFRARSYNASLPLTNGMQTVALNECIREDAWLNDKLNLKNLN